MTSAEATAAQSPATMRTDAETEKAFTTLTVMESRLQSPFG